MRSVPFGEQLIREGDTGVATDELYVVASGHFEVYSDAKVANRDIRVWHGATENGP